MATSLLSRCAGAAARASSRRALHSSPALRMAEPAAAESASQLHLTLAGPVKPIINNEPVYLVNIPGMTGEYGVAADHAPVIAELKPGLVSVFKTDGAEADKYFVSAGLAVTHPDSTTTISVAEIAALEDLDVSKAQAALAEAKKAQEAAAEESPEAAAAAIEVEVCEGVLQALGQNV